MGETNGSKALVIGSGGWCLPFHHQLPQALPKIEARFDRVFVLPSTFDLSDPTVRQTLAASKARIYARDRVSFNQINKLGDAALSHDHAFYFDYRPHIREGLRHLFAFREDIGSASKDVPEGNVDISDRCFGLDHWLWTISRHGSVDTDRAHVLIAAACLGKSVRYRPSNDHKVVAISEHALRSFKHVSPL